MLPAYLPAEQDTGSDMTDRAPIADTTDRDSERGKLRRRAWGLYSWGSRAHWISTLFASRADVAVSLAALGLIGGVAATTITDATMRADKGTGRVAALTERVGGNATLFGIEGRDEAGRRAAFDLVVFDKRFDWVRGSTSELVRDGDILTEAQITKDILDGPVRDRLARAKEVIAVGTASIEGELAAETHRAGQRARQTAAWTAAVLPAGIPLYTLNLGQYREPCQDCETAGTSWQRPFMVVAVREKDHGADVAQALAAAMSGKSNLPSLAAYSTFGLAKFR